MSEEEAGSLDGAAAEEDASSLVDEVFGAAKPKKVERASEPSADEGEEASHGADEAELSAPAAEASSEAEAVAEPAAALKAGKAGESADSAKRDAAEEPIAAVKAEAADKKAAAKSQAAAEPEVADAEAADSAAAAGAPTDPAPAPRRTGSLRTRLAAAVTVLAIAGAAGVLVLTGSGSSKGSASLPGGAPATTQPSVNPQAFYPATQHDTPFATGATSSVLTDDALNAAVPGCGACKLVTRANGFTPDGGVLALFRTGDPAVGKPNFKLVVVGGDGKLVWSAPPGVQALTSGIERFSTDEAGNYYLALPGSRSGYILIALAWRDGKVVDIGDLLHPKVSADAVVGVLPEPTPGATATIVAQTRDGVPDATTGGLIESQYQIRGGAPVLIGCRRHVGESGEWVTFQPDPAKGCVDAPPGPVGPPDGDQTTGP